MKILKEPENRQISFFKDILPSLERLDGNKTLMFQNRVLQILTELHQPQGYCPNSNNQDGYQTQHFVTSQQMPLICPQSSASNILDQFHLVMIFLTQAY